jgi:PucR C-terminal helix-turn-helix domain/GGDEF-like domain
MSGGVTGGDLTRGSKLADILDPLGPLVLHAAATPHGLDARISETLIYDEMDTLPSLPGAILLAVGAALDKPETVDLIRQAGAAGYGAVVVKGRGADLETAIYSAERAGLALLVAQDDLPWRHLDALITAAMNASTPIRDTYSSVSAGDLFALANAIAYSVGGATTIEDPTGHVLAYSTLPHQEIDEIRRHSILGRRTPDRPTNTAEYELVFRAEGPYRFLVGKPNHFDRLAIAVRAGPEVLGAIWVLDAVPRLGEGAAKALQEAAKITAMHLLRIRSHRQPDRWRRAEALASLLGGGMTGQVAADHLKLPRTGPWAILAFAEAAPNTAPGLGIAQIIDLVSVYCEAWHPNALCGSADGVVYAIVPVHDDADLHRRISRFATEVSTTVERSTGIAVQVGICVPLSRLDEAAAGRRAADRVLQALTANPDRTVATTEDVRSRVILLELAERRAGGGEMQPVLLRGMLEHDELHGTSYALTLLTYLDSFADVPRAAAALFVHENTLRYRIRRVRELFDLDLEDPETRLVTWLQLHLLQLSS